MNVRRVCLQCRSAKAKCDRVRPVCGRCTQREIDCSGSLPDEDFIFRDENDIAERNSRRARREGTERRSSHTPPDVRLRRTIRNQHAQASSSGPVDFDAMARYWWWLSERKVTDLPGPLKRDLETRAVERFFVNWTLYPGNDGMSPGYMYDLHTLYQTATPQSVLWLAIRAVACADLRQEVVPGDIPFHVRARQYYGSALRHLRAFAITEQQLADYHVLAAILLIDNFELMYLSRSEPLGPHRDAIRHILQTASEDHLFSESHFALWCVAHQRLQARQLLLREEPDPAQLAWVSKLNVQRPDIRISADVLLMNILSSRARKLTQEDDRSASSTTTTAHQLARTVQDVIASIESWTSNLSGAWRPTQAASHPAATLGGVDEEHFAYPVPRFPCPRTLAYHDLWLAHMWNLHAASQIVVRESLVDVLVTFAGGDADADAEADDDDDDDDGVQVVIQRQREAVDELAAAIIQSLPGLLGFAHRNDPEAPRQPPHGKMAGRLFSIFSMGVVQQAQFASALHKQTAAEVLRWINARHVLD